MGYYGDVVLGTPGPVSIVDNLILDLFEKIKSLPLVLHNIISGYSLDMSNRGVPDYY